MPHLQFEINKKLNKDLKEKFIKFVEVSFSEIMQTGTDHVAISIREFEKSNLSLGRAKNHQFICLMFLLVRYELHFEKCLLPKKLLYADNGDGCEDLKIKFLSSLINCSKIFA